MLAIFKSFGSSLVITPGSYGLLDENILHDFECRKTAENGRMRQWLRKVKLINSRQRKCLH